MTCKHRLDDPAHRLLCERIPLVLYPPEELQAMRDRLNSVQVFQLQEELCDGEGVSNFDFDKVSLTPAGRLWAEQVKRAEFAEAKATVLETAIVTVLAALKDDSCTCSGLDIGVGEMHEPGCGWPNRDDLVACIEDALAKKAIP